MGGVSDPAGTLGRMSTADQEHSARLHGEALLAAQDDLFQLLLDRLPRWPRAATISGPRWLGPSPVTGWHNRSDTSATN